MRHHRWEYLTTSAEALTDERLNELGGVGWELVAIHESRAIFKRTGPDFRDRITIAQRERVDAQVNGSGNEA